MKFCVLWNICDISSNHSGRIPQTVVRISTVIPLFTLFWDFEGLHQFPGAIPSLRSNSGLEDEHEFDESCGGDVDDELLPKLVDNPGTTRGTKLSVLHKNVFSSLVNRGF